MLIFASTGHIRPLLRSPRQAATSSRLQPASYRLPAVVNPWFEGTFAPGFLTGLEACSVGFAGPGSGLSEVSMCGGRSAALDEYPCGMSVLEIDGLTLSCEVYGAARPS